MFRIGNVLSSIKHSLNSFFSHIYCLNLERRTDRWEKIRRKFELYDVKVQRFVAIDGQRLVHLNSVSEFYGGRVWLTREALGCLLSHIEIFKDAQRNRYERILVLEDDILFHRKFNDKLRVLGDLPDWKLLYLGATQYHWEGLRFASGYYYAYRTLGTFALGIDSSIYDELIELFSQKELASDACLAKYVQVRYPSHCLVLYPNLVISDITDSDIREWQDVKTHVRKARWDLSQYV